MVGETRSVVNSPLGWEGVRVGAVDGAVVAGDGIEAPLVS